MFDVFLACAPKDYNKLPYVIDSVYRNVEGFDGVLICSPTDIPIDVLRKIPIAYSLARDEDGLPGVIRERWKHRPNWCFQQHLKLFQKLTGEWYLTLDCDTIINRKMQFFNGDKPIYWKGYDQHYDPYFTFMACMLGIHKVCKRSCIADMNLINRQMIVEMLERYEYTVDSFIQKSQTVTNKNCHIGEPELYGNYVEKFHPGMYEERILVQSHTHDGRQQDRETDWVWSSGEIERIIKDMGRQDFDTISLHSWYNEGFKGL